MAEPVSETSRILVNLGPWVISVIALAQVWALALYRRFRKPVIEIYESQNIEVGFSQFGPTIGLMGTLRTIHRDAFIEGIDLVVHRKKDGASHQFHWRAFRSNTIAVNPDQQPPIEMAASFMLTPDRPLKFNIFFVEDRFIAELSPVASAMVAKYFDFRMEQAAELKEAVGDDYTNLLSHPLFEENVYDGFSKEPGCIDTYTAFDRAFYWDAGSYDIDIVVHSSAPDLTVTKRKSFTLSEDDASALRLNIIAVMRQLCGLNAHLSFANPEYQDQDRTCQSS